MAFGRLERSKGPQPMSDINMTPLIDVMLVLLVIFMLTAPLMTSALKLDLPTAEAPPSDTPEPDLLAIAVTADGRLYWGEDLVTADQLRQRIRQAAQRNPAREVQLRADTKVPYGTVAQLLSWLQQSGLNRIAFVTDAPQGGNADTPAAPRPR